MDGGYRLMRVYGPLVLAMLYLMVESSWSWACGTCTRMMLRLAYGCRIDMVEWLGDAGGSDGPVVHGCMRAF